MTEKHSPLPFKMIDMSKSAADGYRPMLVIKSGNKQVATSSWNDDSPWFPTQEEAASNFDLIIRSVNGLPEAIAALENIDVYGSDTLSGRADGGADDREWQREAVREMRNRARAALTKLKG